MDTTINITCPQSGCQISIHVSVPENATNTKPIVEVVDDSKPAESKTSTPIKIKPIDWDNYKPSIENKDELKKIIEERIAKEGPACNLNDIDTSQITDMSELFYKSAFDGDISKWDVSNVKNMKWMFAKSQFNGDISKWDVSEVENMDYIFYNSKFDRDLSKWVLHKNVGMVDAFKNSPLEKQTQKQPKKQPMP